MPVLPLQHPTRRFLGSLELSASDLLRSAPAYWDAKYSSASDTVPNLGYGGSALNATLGSSSSPDSNDPQWLPFTGTNYVYMPSGIGNSISVPDAAPLDITGDIDIRIKIAMDDWTPASEQFIAGKWDGVSQCSWTVTIKTDGAVRWLSSNTGGYVGDTDKTSTASTGFTDGSAHWLRITMDVDNGASNYDLKFWTSDDGAVWTQLGSTRNGTAATSIYASTSAVFFGTVNAPNAGCAAKVYRGMMLNGIAGTTVLDVDTSVVTGSSTSFTATTGQTVTVNRATSGRKTVCVTAPCWLLGTDDYMEVPDNALLDFGASDSFTVITIQRLWGTPGSYRRTIAKRTTAAGNPGWELTTEDTNRAVGFLVRDGVAQTFSFSTTAETSGAQATWAGVRDVALDKVFAVRGGTFNAGVTDATTLTLVNSENLRIGTASASGTGIDMEFVAAAVFRTALTAAQVQAISDYFANRVAV